MNNNHAQLLFLLPYGLSSKGKINVGKFVNVICKRMSVEKPLFIFVSNVLLATMVLDTSLKSKKQ